MSTPAIAPAVAARHMPAERLFHPVELGRYDLPHRMLIENRARLLIEVVEAVSEVWDADRVGVRLSPLGTFNDISDDDPETTFGYIAKMLSDYRLAYLHLVNPAVAAIEQGTEPVRARLGCSISSVKNTGARWSWPVASTRTLPRPGWSRARRI